MSMKKVAIVSCDKWVNRLEEDNNLKNALTNLGIDTSIISWQQPLCENYDLLILRSVWGYQNFYNEFKEWLIYIKNNNIPLVNDVDMVLNNIMKDRQFDILRRNNIDVIDTIFLSKTEFLSENILDNCQTWLYLKTANIDTATKIMKKLGNYTTSSYSRSSSYSKNQNGSNSESMNLISRPLLTEDEVLRIQRPYVLVINAGNYPAIVKIPDLSKWHFNKLFGLGDEIVIFHLLNLQAMKEIQFPHHGHLKLTLYHIRELLTEFFISSSKQNIIHINLNN